MNRKSIVFATTLFTAGATIALPTVTQAATHRDGLQACVKAMTSELSESRTNEFQVLLESTLALPNRRMTTTEVFHLDARAKGDDEVLSRVDCVVNSRASVRSLRILPLDAAQASSRAKN